MPLAKPGIQTIESHAVAHFRTQIRILRPKRIGIRPKIRMRIWYWLWLWPFRKGPFWGGGGILQGHQGKTVDNPSTTTCNLDMSGGPSVRKIGGGDAIKATLGGQDLGGWGRGCVACKNLHPIAKGLSRSNPQHHPCVQVQRVVDHPLQRNPFAGDNTSPQSTPGTVY